MAGAEFVADRRIVLGALVDILDEKRNRGARRHRSAGPFILKDAGEDFDLIGLAPLRGEARLAGAALVEIGLDFGGGERDAGRTAIDDTAERRPMAFTEGRHPEHMAEAVMRHGAIA